MKARMLGAFFYASQECPGADFETEGGPVEFKTPRSVGKVNGLLVNASKKFGTYPGEAKVVVILASSCCRTRRRRRLGQRVALQRWHARWGCGAWARWHASQLKTDGDTLPRFLTQGCSPSISNILQWGVAER